MKTLDPQAKGTGRHIACFVLEPDASAPTTTTPPSSAESPSTDREGES